MMLLTQTWIEIAKSCSGSTADIFELERSTFLAQLIQRLKEVHNTT